MGNIHDIFNLTISKDSMTVSMDKKGEFELQIFDEDTVQNFLDDHKIVYGIDETVVKQLTEASYDMNVFPVVIAKGLPPTHGKNGEIHFIDGHNNVISHEEKQNFRDVYKIPSKKNGEKIAYITKPTLGEVGFNVYGKEVRQIKGKHVKVKAGKHVEFVESDATYYARADGQLSVNDKFIHVYPTYEVAGDLSLKTGNIDFVGSITIRGSVPAGYTVKAAGDIHIHGLVEAAYIEAGGSIYISEGIAGLKKGKVIAGQDVKVGYINQATVEAGQDLIVQNSIIHSHCVAQQNITCQNGNIIGGIYSAGKLITAKDIGNKMYTKTELSLGVNSKLREKEKALHKQKKDLLSNKNKLQQLGDSLKLKEKTSSGISSKERIILLKQRRAMEQTEAQLEEIENELSELQVSIGNLEEMKLLVKGIMYPNVDVSFGKYKKSITKEYKFTQVYMDDHEITIQSL
ncbi:FapA family protein [Aquibacillus koreensis]|uniref:FapA family protein n=1 Tax=Aquibacillus koreensis TaxID=279446 RepID=A0A9X3WN86_9BACI|nr:FapA family protein [Aquibacillus koreensis]MCT2534548.1 FapA family protein [Aquibacillus koreensis]MDC3421858.1 FapA family protein [Aquibacillus koreensis]